MTIVLYPDGYMSILIKFDVDVLICIAAMRFIARNEHQSNTPDKRAQLTFYYIAIVCLGFKAFNINVLNK